MFIDLGKRPFLITYYLIPKKKLFSSLLFINRFILTFFFSFLKDDLRLRSNEYDLNITRFLAKVLQRYYEKFVRPHKTI